MLVNADPWGLEVGITTLVAFAIYALNDDRNQRFDRSLTNLSADPSKVEAWVRSYWRSYMRLRLVTATWAVPCGEEALCRSLPVAVVQFNPTWWPAAVVVGLLTNVVFATSHQGMPNGYFQAKHRHQIVIFILGMAAFGASMWTGLLVTAIVIHALFNIVLSGSIASYRANRDMCHVQVAGRHYAFCLKSSGAC